MSRSSDETPDQEAKPAARQGIQSVELAMTVLQAIEQGLGPMSLTEIAAASDMGASKAHRYLVSLCRAGLVAQSQRSGRYDLGPGMRRLGIESLRRMDEVGLASEHLPGLRDKTSHAANLAVWGDNGPVIVRWDYGAHALPITVRVGATMPLLTSSVGLIYLAYLPRTMTDPILEKQLTQQGQHKPRRKDIDRLRTEVRHEGLATTSGGVIPGVTSVAAPAFPAGDSIPLALALALPERLADDDTMTQLKRDLLRVAGEISAELGGSRETVRDI